MSGSYPEVAESLSAGTAMKPKFDYDESVRVVNAYEPGTVYVLKNPPPFDFDLTVSEYQVFGSGVVFLIQPNGDRVWRFPQEIKRKKI